MRKKILVIKSSSMGDVVHALPVAGDIKTAFPDCELHWVVEESFCDIVGLSPFIDHRIVTAFRRWRKSPFASKTRSEFAAVRRELRENKYDLVIDLQGLMRSALIAFCSGSQSIGYSRGTIREPMASYLYTNTLAVAESLKPVRRYRVMAARSLGYSIDEDHPHFGLDVAPVLPEGVNGPYVVLAVNTSRPEKLWAQHRWIDVAQRLRLRGLVSVLCWGNEVERQRVEEIADAVDGAVVLPRSNLRTLAGVIAGASAMLGVDTGLAHLGAALGVPSVGIIVGTSAELFSLVSEGPCMTIGDKGVVPTAEEVFDAYLKVMP